MLTNTEIKRRGLKEPSKKPEDVDAKKYIPLLSKEKFDYTLWQSTLWEEQSAQNKLVARSS